MAAPLNPKGAKSDKIWRDAIMRAVRRLGSDEPPEKPTEAQRLDLLADALVCKGILGDVPAIKEVGDRLDGKATQPIGGDADSPLSIVHRLVREIVDPKNAADRDSEDIPAAS